MSLAPLTAAPLSIIIHTAAAFAAFSLGVFQFVAAKGTLPHRIVGWTWAVLMTTVALSSFWIHTICTFGDFSPIHGLSIVTLVTLPVAVAHARGHRVRQHKRAMTLLFAGALVVAGLLTLMPGRLMHDVVFGTATAGYTCR